MNTADLHFMTVLTDLYFDGFHYKNFCDKTISKFLANIYLFKVTVEALEKGLKYVQS